MRWLAELGAKQENPVAIAYEPWCFSPRVSDWEHCYEIIKKAVSDMHFTSPPYAQVVVN